MDSLLRRVAVSEYQEVTDYRSQEVRISGS